MISHKHKCIFIHIPKCAGTSIESALGHLDGHTGRGGQDHRSIRMIENPILSIKTISSKENLQELTRRFLYQLRRTRHNPNNVFTVSSQQYDNYYKFAVVRNPWARAYSWYENVMRDEVHKKTFNISKELSLTEFLREHIGKGMLRPQTYWIKNFKGEIPLDNIIRFENLAEEFNQVTKTLGAPQIALPHKIKGSSQNHLKYYTNESIKLIETVYKDEIEMFGYSFS